MFVICLIVSPHLRGASQAGKRLFLDLLLKLVNKPVKLRFFQIHTFFLEITHNFVSEIITFFGSEKQTERGAYQGTAHYSQYNV